MNDMSKKPQNVDTSAERVHESDKSIHEPWNTSDMAHRTGGLSVEQSIAQPEQEPLTKAEICRKLGLTHDQVANRLSHLKRAPNRYPKRIYIYRYTRHAILGRAYIRPVYALGNKPDTKSTLSPLTIKERAARSYSKLLSLRNNSIFNQTATRRELSKQRSNHE